MTQIFSYQKHGSRLSRALKKQGIEEVFWSEIGGEIAERLQFVKREFDKIAIISFFAREECLQAQILKSLNLHERQKSIAFFSPIEFLKCDHKLDAIIAYDGLHMIDELPDLIARAKKVLRPDGLFIGRVLGEASLQELRHALTHVETTLYGGAFLRVHPSIDRRDFAGLLQAAGFALPVIDMSRKTLVYKSLARLIQDLRDIGYTSILKGRSKFRPKPFFDGVEAFLKNGKDQMDITVDMIDFIAWAPAISQQKPLKRGSAEKSLTEILE